tara:strand:- start:90 stop:230 length:141 start_codon:yes stop_codon:yes gene_type:complete
LQSYTFAIRRLRFVVCSLSFAETEIVENEWRVESLIPSMTTGKFGR